MRFFGRFFWINKSLTRTHVFMGRILPAPLVPFLLRPAADLFRISSFFFLVAGSPHPFDSVPRPSATSLTDWGSGHISKIDIHFYEPVSVSPCHATKNGAGGAQEVATSGCLLRWTRSFVSG